MSNHRVHAGLTGHPELIRLATEADEAALEHRKIKGEVERTLRKLDGARAADAKAAADAIEAGRKIPEPTEVALRAEADDLGRKLAAVTEVMNRSVHRVRGALLHDIGTQILTETKTRHAERLKAIDDALGALAIAVGNLDDDQRVIRWIEDFRHRHEHGQYDSGSIPKPDAAELQIPFGGGHYFDIGAIVDRIRAAMPTPDPDPDGHDGNREPVAV